MKLLIWMTFFISSITSSSGQSRSVRSWDLGPLSWDDFHPILSEGTVPGSFQNSFRLGKEKFWQGDTLVKRLVVRTDLYPEGCWHDPDLRTPSSLRYYQAAFDRTEYEARFLQTDLDRCRTGVCIDRLLDSAAARSGAWADSMDRFILAGDEPGFEALLLENSDALKELCREKRVLVRPAACEIGLSVGGGLLRSTTALGSEFVVPALFGVDWSFSVRRYVMRFAYERGGADPGSGPQELRTLFQRTDPSVQSAHLSLGYTLRLADHWEAVPYVGFRYIEIAGGDEDKYEVLASRSVLVGVRVERSFHRVLKLLSAREYDEFGLFAELHGGKVDMGTGVTGTSFSALAGIYFTASWVK